MRSDMTYLSAVLACICGMFSLINSSPVPDSVTVTSVFTVTNRVLPRASDMSFGNSGFLPIDNPLLTVESKVTKGGPSHRSITPTASNTDSASATAEARPNPIRNGYVAFGDSFAAGFGTGITTTDSCRRGGFSYPKLLCVSQPNHKICENYECSGAIIPEILQGGSESQIDRWSNADKADVGTISIGGNDLLFSELVDACVIRFFLGASGDCEKKISFAQTTMDSDIFKSNLTKTYLQILEKAGNPEFQLFVTGYTAFFNVDTEFCNKASFHFWKPENPSLPCSLDRRPCLTKELRQRLNNLVTDLNRIIASAVDDAQAQSDKRIRFIDPNPRFNGHRFCEQENGQDVQEPAAKRADTWFFLAGWPDNKLEGGLRPVPLDEIELARTGNTTAIPDVATACADTKDPEDYFMCAIATINANPAQFPEQFQVLADSQAAVRGEGEFKAEHVPWWIPTRWGKAFHPRTLGQKAYADAIMEVW